SIMDCTIYEDAEDGYTTGWIIYDKDPSGASISNVYDNDRQSRVIELSREYRDYNYLLQNLDGSGWNNSSQFIAKWSMKYSNYFIIYINIRTTTGDKYVFYTPDDFDALGLGDYIHQGLGSNVKDGQWHSLERDLQADLEEAQPGTVILAVNSFKIYGSGRVDDIMLCNILMLSNMPSATNNNTPLNSVPIAYNQSITTSEDTPKAIILTASDPDLDPLTYTIMTQPSHGTLSGPAPNLTYSPTANYYGSDSFTFKVNDGHGDSNIATLSITITSVNDPPVANAQIFATQEDVAINKTLSASDIDGDGLIYSIVANGTKGIAVITNASTGAFKYTPNKDINGTDTFSFKVNDGKTYSTTATVTVNISPVNDAPVADSQSLDTYENTALLAISLTGSDVEGNILIYTIVTQPSNGTLSGTAPKLTYTPNNNFAGSDSFSFKVYDGIVYSNTAIISITVTPVEDSIMDCTIYEDAEDGYTTGWIIYDKDPSNAWIANVFDSDRQSHVIELGSVNRDYCYLFQNENGSKLKNASQLMAKWSMKYSDYFVVYFNVHTTTGDKYIYYTPVDFNTLGTGNYVHHGIGSNVADGQWHSFERDLQADLTEAQAGEIILYINNFMIYGSGLVDDIELCDTNQN
ncbi:MAG: Ig-like domain-containing protein, partial [bacterium]